MFQSWYTDFQSFFFLYRFTDKYTDIYFFFVFMYRKLLNWYGEFLKTCLFLTSFSLGKSLARKELTISNNKIFFWKGLAKFRGCRSIQQIAMLNWTGINHWAKLQDQASELYESLSLIEYRELEDTNRSF